MDPALPGRHGKYPKTPDSTLSERAGCFCGPETDQAGAKAGKTHEISLEKSRHVRYNGTVNRISVIGGQYAAA